MKYISLLAVYLSGMLVSLAQAQPGTVLWTYNSGSGSSPALAPDGTIYITGSAGLVAVTNSGSTASNKWSFPAVGPSAVATDGTVYVANGGSLYAVKPDGSEKWTFIASTSGSASSTAPAIGFDDSVYLLAAGRLFAVSPSGSEKWQYLLDVSGIGLQAPVVGSDDTIYVALERTLYAFNAQGTNKWTANLTQAGTKSLSLDLEKTIYSSGGPLQAFNLDGTKRWSTDYDRLPGSPIIGKEGTIYLAAWNRELYAITDGGEVSWDNLDSNPQYGEYTAPAVDAGGRIYYCVSNSVWCLAPHGEVQWKITGSQIGDPRFDVANTSPIIGPDGTLYVALGSTLYAIATGTNGPANSPWPMYRANARHTGKIEKPALRNPQRRSDANFQFQLYAQLGQTNTVETTTNLSNWTSLTSVVVSTVPMDVVDFTASNFPSRFYRALAP